MTQMDVINGVSASDQAYVLSCTGLVMIMTPGLALFYAGLVRERASVDMLLQNFVALGILSILWYFVGFSLAFGAGPLVGNPLTHFMFQGLSLNAPWPGYTISGPLFGTYQMMFAVITPCLMTGAFADRMNFGPYCIFIVLWVLVVYCPWCHQMWGGGFLSQQGVFDFAGGIVVHITAGWSSLAACLALGKRNIVAEGGDLREPHSIPLVLLGTGILWFGWFGFNGGSALSVDSTAVGAAINSHLSAAVAICVWGAIDWIRQGKAKLVPLCLACVAGLVVITPMAGYVSMNMALITGTVAGSACYGGIVLLIKLGVDDALDVWGVHGVGGALGTMLVGVLANGKECLDKDTAPDYCVFPGSVAASFEQFGLQARAVLISILYSFVVTFVLIRIMMRFMKVKPDEEIFDFLDEELHGEVAYKGPTQPDAYKGLFVKGFSASG
mmetsp:Transcript_8780/g.21952  ORF Transcript_8780/g.21952 Transcript_8780/m.21952 type:complete len:441 (+) Transcript_8780:62-1384(+)